MNKLHEKIFDVDRNGTVSLRKLKIQEVHTPYLVLVFLEINAPQHISTVGSKKCRNHIHFYS